MTRFDEERIAELLGLLRPTPEGLVRAAQELPAARAAIDELVARAEADAELRARLVADLESALRAEGLEASPAVVRALRDLLGAS